MINIIVFGTGSSAEQFLSTIDRSKVKVLAFSDNNPSKHYTLFNRYVVIPPKDILKYEFDYIFVASQFSDEIIPQLIQLGIKSDKIIPSDYERHNYLIKQKHKKVNQLVKQKFLIKNEKLKIALLNYNYSNYNGYALYKYMPDYIKEKYDVDLIEEKNRGKLATYDVIVSSDFDGIYEDNYINIETWHGFPLKKMGVLINNTSLVEESVEDIRIKTNNTAIFCSYSHLYTTFFNSCFPSNINKYRVTGIPRNDFLYENTGIKKLERLTSKNLRNKNIAFYLPTWRQNRSENINKGNVNWNQLFEYIEGKKTHIINMLKKQNLFLIVKLHPVEYKLFEDLSFFKNERVYLLSDEGLVSSQTHLYELVSAADLLITDYSSVFFDTLLIDLPVIFTPTDLEEYQRNRGFLIEPYESMTPGPIVSSLNELDKEIGLILNGQDRFKERREQIRSIVLKYRDNKSSQRVWKEIDKYLKELY